MRMKQIYARVVRLKFKWRRILAVDIKANASRWSAERAEYIKPANDNGSLLIAFESHHKSCEDRSTNATMRR